MMPEDLMKGNFVRIFDFPNTNPKLEQGYTIEIKSIISDSPYHGDVRICFTYSGKEEWVLLRDCYPIPLTEEILYKNGFRKLSDGDWELKYIDTNYSIVYSNGAIYLATFYTLSKDYVRICVCEYVHELQNKCKMLDIGIPNKKFEV